MGKFVIDITDEAKIHLRKHKKAGDKATIKKIDTILMELTETPYSGSGQPEQLKHNLKGFWSRKINQKDRMIYTVNEKIVTIEIISAMGHYSDK